MFKPYVPSGGGGSFDSATSTYMNDDVKFGYGTSQDYAFLYDTTNTALELSSSTAGKVLWIEDGTDDVNFSGSLALNVGEKLRLNGPAGNDYITSGGATISVYANNTLHMVIGSTQTEFRRSTKLYDDFGHFFGTSQDYWMLYDTTNTAFELWSTDADGALNDGKVLWIEDGTDDVNFSGSLYLRNGQGIVFDSDQPSGNNNKIYGITTNWIAIMTAGAASMNFINSGGVHYVHTPDNVSLGVGTSNDYAFKYVSADTQFQLNSAAGKVLWIEDGTDDVNFSGSINFQGAYISGSNDGKITLGGMGGTNNENLVLDFETNANILSYNSTTGVNIHYFVGSVRAGALNAFQFNGRSQLASWADGQFGFVNNANTTGATLDITTADTFIVKDKAGTGAGSLFASGTLGTEASDVATISTGSYVPGEMKFVSDGNAGSPCLAVYYNGDWYRLTAGAVISDA